MMLTVRPSYAFDLVDTKTVFSIPVPPRLSGGVTVLETCALLSFAKWLEGKRGPNGASMFEFGTFKGQTTRTIVLNLPALAVSTLDLNPSLSDVLLNGSLNVTRLKGHSGSFDFAPFSKTFDLIFIDGGHDYYTVKSDTENAVRMVRPGGIIVWHDYGTPEWDVTKYLDEVAETLNIHRVEETSLCFYEEPGVAA
jgi:predicted O-methyltransferase YrrM